MYKITEPLKEPEREQENPGHVKTASRISLKVQLRANKNRIDDYKP